MLQFVAGLFWPRNRSLCSIIVYDHNSPIAASRDYANRVDRFIIVAFICFLGESVDRPVWSL